MDIRFYKKDKSFSTFYSRIGTDVEGQRRRAISALERVCAIPAGSRLEIFSAALEELRRGAGSAFAITSMIADELSRIEDELIPRYIYHRYRYDMFPRQRVLDGHPPYLQIEPASLCNYRCVFCYQTDSFFSSKAKGDMGMMSPDLFRMIIDDIKGKVDFLSLASRGEPLLCRDIDVMLEYCAGKFLGLKMNTNASLLNEKHCHAILAGGVNTIVFSVDASDSEAYGRFRVHGKFDQVLNNIRLFQDIRRRHYPRSKIISRVSGVKFEEGQDIDQMVDFWGELVDQVCFVNYNPWENVYATAPNGVEAPCSDLWRRMFIWFDGKVNPCDVDYLSSLSVGSFPEMSIAQLWSSEGYDRLRRMHSASLRNACEPCRRCSLV